jgi:hypothetical protein
VAVCYLVAAIAKDAEEAHRLLGRLLFAAMADKRFEVDLQSLELATWRAFGVVPQPAFLLRFPFSLERPQQRQRVTEYPKIRPAPAVPFSGVLLGPRDVPIAGARVTLSELGIHTTTDSNGRFRFAVVPPGSHPRRLRIEARGLEVETVAVPPTERTNGPAIIRFTQLED